jgi:hypothetical protein
VILPLFTAGECGVFDDLGWEDYVTDRHRMRCVDVDAEIDRMRVR